MTNELEGQSEHKALPARPRLEESPEDNLRVVGDPHAPDVQFVLSVAAQCLAQAFSKGGDLRYAAQNAIIEARRLLGAAVAVGIMESETLLEGGENLWLSPAVPGHGQSSAPRGAGSQLG